MPKVSVIVPIYGVDKFLNEAVDSVLKQTLSDIEIILIDDGGKDKCPEIIDDYAKKDSRVIAIHKENSGYGSTCNFGIERATGKYIAILEPDDFIDSKMYEDLYSIAEKTGADIVKSSFWENLRISDTNYLTKKIFWNERIKFPEGNFNIKDCPIFLQLHPSIWSCIYKKDFLISNDIKFNEIPGAGWSDNLFQVQTLCLANNIVYTPKAYYFWRKLIENPSEELKDYTLPLKRSEEIHTWLEQNNIDNKQILANLYKREFNYINIVLGMNKIEDKVDCMKRISNLCISMKKDVIYESDIFSKKDILLYESILKNPNKLYMNSRIKLLRKSIFSFKLSKNRKYLKICGFCLFDVRY